MKHATLELPLFEQEPSSSDEPLRKKRKSPSGEATTELVFSSYAGENAELFLKILRLHVAQGAVVADVTYGLGAFWREVPEGEYVLRPSDLKSGVDCRKLPYKDGSIDCVVFDPPYMEGLFRDDDSKAGNGTHSAFQTAYSNGQRPDGLDAKWHDAVLQLYVQAAIEARRVLKAKGGVYIVKCQDEVSAGVQRLTHVELIMNYLRLGYYPKDLFVLTRLNKPGVSRSLKQLHARKNHSYFLVFTTGATRSKLQCVALQVPDARRVRQSQRPKRKKGQKNTGQKSAKK